ncbi:phenol 2-monooxygenase [Hortaea werneckii]|nr:phenol 2-monooxygenase [Hortaea werneckii]
MTINESRIDVLIVGAGPAGLMVAYWMARCGIKARIIDKQKHKVYNGHADGLRSRTEEIFDSMGGDLQRRIEAEGYIFESFRTWVPGEHGRIVCAHRTNLMTDQIATLPSPFVSLTISQGRIERFLVDNIEETSGTLKVERGVSAESFTYDSSLQDDHDAYPIKVTLRTLSDTEVNDTIASYGYGGRYIVSKNNLAQDELKALESASPRKLGTEIVEARYLVGADGAHSWLRHNLGYKTQGSGLDSLWGVMDVVPITDFPDIRYPGFIEGEHGALMVLPRERNMTRIYVPFKPNTPEHHDRATIDLETIRCRAQTFFKGYTFDFKICEWWSVYQVGQRVSERSQNPSGRIFLAGDAVHMHSPKIGLGMNTSMQDGYNLGWKVALAAARAVRSPAELLATYEMERLPVAKTLVNFDRALWTNEGAMDPGEFQKTHEAFREFADGRKLMYPENLIISKTTGSQSAARKLIVGESFIHAKVLGHADSQLYWTTRLFQSDGRFRIVLMAGDIDAEEQFERVKHLCKRISAGGQADGRCNALVSRYPYPFEAPTRFQPACADPTGQQHPAITFDHERPLDSMISLLTIHSGQQYASRSIFDFPDTLRGPFDPDYHGWDYRRIFVDTASHLDRYCDGGAYDLWGVDRSRGALVVVRPDMHVGWVGEIEDVDGMENYFVSIFGH